MFTGTHQPAASSKATAVHLRRDAYLYVRQSTIKQVLNNTESTRRQYDLRGRAIALGWTSEQIIVIDIDQGQSGASAADREGFQRLVADVSLGKAGHRAGPGMLPPGQKQRRLAPAPGAVRDDRHADLRRRRPL